MSVSEIIHWWLRGYVVFRASGEQLERFLSRAGGGGVALRDVWRPGDRWLVGKVPVRAFKDLRRLARRSGVHLQVMQRGGWPFTWSRLRRRPGTLAGVAVAAALVVALGSRVWVVTVDGPPGFDVAGVRQVLARSGVLPGIARRAVDPRALEHQLLAQLPGLAWVDVELTGSRVRVQVVPRRNGQDEELGQGDVVATADGLVTEVVVARGWPLVAAGDVVRKGQVLIAGSPPAGTLPPGDEPVGGVRAAGTVRARVWVEGYAEQPLAIAFDRPTGRRASGWVLRLGPWRWNAGAVRPPFARFATSVRGGKLRAGPFELPVTLEQVRHEELESFRILVTADQARRTAEELAMERALSYLGARPQILSTRVTATTGTQGTGPKATGVVGVHVLVEALQEIGVYLPAGAGYRTE